MLLLKKPTPTLMTAIDRNSASSGGRPSSEGDACRDHRSRAGKEMDRKPAPMNSMPAIAALREPSQRSATKPPTTGSIQISAPYAATMRFPSASESP
jgi:hypothetical protein